MFFIYSLFLGDVFGRHSYRVPRVMDARDWAGKKTSQSTPTVSPASPRAALHQGLMVGLTVGGTPGGGASDCGYELSHGWLRHSPAEALFSGTISSMGSRKCVKLLASSCAQPYFSTSTSNSDHGFSLVMCRSSPAGGGVTG